MGQSSFEVAYFLGHLFSYAVEEENSATRARSRLAPNPKNPEINSDCGPMSTVVHELGHYMGLVADGYGNKPDNQGNHYNNALGTAGTPQHHCQNPASLSDKDHCVMHYDGSSHTRPEAFCNLCRVQLRKVDLTGRVQSLLELK